MVLALSPQDGAVRANAELVHRLVARFSGRGVAREDLVQEAWVALLSALGRYDASRGPSFSAYASVTVVGHLKRYFRDYTWAVRVPRAVSDGAVRVRRIADDLTQELGRYPTPDELGGRSGLSTDEVRSAAAATEVYAATQLDASDVSSDDTTSTESDFAAVEATIVVGRLLEHLPPRERRIVQLRFLGECTQAEIGRAMGISQMHVSRLLRRALESMRRQVEREGVVEGREPCRVSSSATR